MLLLESIRWARNSTRYSEFVGFIKGLKVIKYKTVDLDTYINTLTKTKSVEEDTLRGILDLYLFNAKLKSTSMNFTLGLSTLKDINTFLCNDVSESKLRTTAIYNKVNIALFDKYLRSTLPVITNTIDLFEKKQYSYEYGNIHDYNTEEDASTLQWKLHYLELFEKHSHLTNILGITILNYNKTGRLTIPITI